VALLQWAGFEATGLELSPTLVKFGRDVSGAPMLLGPVEEQDVPRSWLDMIAAMDVLEHLLDPVATMGHCVRLLKVDGVLLIQTPRYVEGRTFEQMTSENGPFLRQLKPEQHLFLFSHTAIRQLFASAGLRKVEFLPAVIAHCDMFLGAARRRLRHRRSSQIRDHLDATPSGRMIGALLDKDDELKQTIRRMEKCEADRSARLVVIEEQA